MRSSWYIFVKEMDILANRYNTMKEVTQEYYKSTKETWYLTCSLILQSEKRITIPIFHSLASIFLFLVVSLIDTTKNS